MDNIAITRILKYPLRGNGEVNLITCRKQRLLDIQEQSQDMVCWIETRDDLPEVTTALFAIGTGWEMSARIIDHARYFKTVQDAFGYVWHFYELDQISLPQ